MEKMQFGLTPISVPYLKLVTVEPDDAVSSAHIGGSIDFSFEVDEEDNDKILNYPEVAVSLSLEIRVSNLDIEMQLKGQVMIENYQARINELKEDYEIKRKIVSPFLAKASQVLANLTADNGPYPLILELDYDDLFSDDNQEEKLEN